VLPAGATIVNAEGQDNGLRFVDLNEDGADDVVFSNDESYSTHLMVPSMVLGVQPGWSREVLRGRRGQLPELPRIVRSGPAPNNGVWFTRREMYVQNEDTARLPHLVARHSFAELLSGLMPAALTPTQSLATLQVPTNFVVELVAHEPLVQDPVYLDWGEDGKLWVVEMRDYPLGVDGRGKAGGAIRVLEDRDGNGRYEHSTLFAEGLNFPNGLLPWRKGVLISAAPDILYAEDTDGDGKADKIEKLFTGFGEGNQQHRFNGFEYGLDNWIYGANGDSGGSIRSLRTGRSVSIGGRDFRFRPDTGELEAVEGQTQLRGETGKNIHRAERHAKHFGPRPGLLLREQTIFAPLQSGVGIAEKAFIGPDIIRTSLKRIGEARREMGEDELLVLGRQPDVQLEHQCQGAFIDSHHSLHVEYEVLKGCQFRRELAKDLF
jgi:hypothetical protein